MKPKQTIALLFALLALHLGAGAQEDTAVVAAAAAPVFPAGEKADSVQAAAPVNYNPGRIGPKARQSAENKQQPGYKPGSIGAEPKK